MSMGRSERGLSQKGGAPGGCLSDGVIHCTNSACAAHTTGNLWWRSGRTQPHWPAATVRLT